MRYDQTHKQETRHSAVLKLAAKALREKGPDGLGVAEVMRSPGLTHGGFYAHFPLHPAHRALFAQRLGASFRTR